MRRLLLSLVLCAYACGGSSSAQSQSASRSDAELAATLERIRAAHDLPGLAAAIVQGSQPTQSAVVGVRRAGAADPIMINDRFHIASCTKGMTAMLAAKLVEQRRMKWTSRLVDVLPELRNRIRDDYKQATLEQLLGHAAHMPAYTQFGPQRLEQLKSLRGTPTEQRLAFLTEVLAKEPPNRGTGDAAYSNVGYTAAALMMERVTGKAWETLIAEEIFRPLNMTHVGFGWPATARTPQQPRGHRGRHASQPIDDDYVLPAALWPAGAVNTSIADLARYAADHLRGLRGEKAMLSDSSYTRLHRTLSGEASGFTLGWGVRIEPQRGRVHYSAGSGGTFFVRIVIVPESNVAVVVASNSGDAGAATREVVAAVLDKHLR